VVNSRQGPGLPGQKVKRRHEGRSVHASQQATYESTASFSPGRALGQSAQYSPSWTPAVQAPAGKAVVPGRVAGQGGLLGCHREQQTVLKTHRGRAGGTAHLEEAEGSRAWGCWETGSAAATQRCAKSLQYKAAQHA
jgi:hypothetical protein